MATSSKSILRRPENPPDRDPLFQRPRRVSYGVTTEVPASESNSSSDLNSTFTNEDSGSNDCNSSPPQKKLTPRQWQILIVILIATCGSSFAVCLFPPFFPRLAEEKGATAGIYGFIIGTNCLVSFLVTPFIGKNVRNSLLHLQFGAQFEKSALKSHFSRTFETSRYSKSEKVQEDSGKFEEIQGKRSPKSLN